LNPAELGSVRASVTITFRNYFTNLTIARCWNNQSGERREFLLFNYW